MVTEERNAKAVARVSTIVADIKKYITDSKGW
jgi:hypothetical protein